MRALGDAIRADPAGLRAGKINARQLEAEPGMGGDLQSFALARAFPHVYGTREELLARAGLTAENIVAAL